MNTFTYQKWKKQESEQGIINALNDGKKSYGELLDLTGLSKPVLSERLKSLETKGKIEIVPEKRIKRFLYRIRGENLDEVETALVLLHRFSQYTLDSLEENAKDQSISDEDYAERLLDGFLILFRFKMLEMFFLPNPIREEWMRSVLGSEYVKRIPKLLPENRNISSFIVEGIAKKEQAIYKSKNAKEAAENFLEYITEIIAKGVRSEKQL